MNGPLREDVLSAGLTLYLIRHDETEWNRDARYQGQQDIPMNDTGRAQARRHGEVLKTLLPEIAVFDFICSPLSRAVETMQIVRGALGQPEDGFRKEPLIAELNYGHWEGTLASDVARTDFESVAAKRADPFHWRPQGGESYADLKTRVCRWLRTLERDTVAVTHGGVSRVARGALFGVPEALVPFLEVPQDKILKLNDRAMSWL